MAVERTNEQFYCRVFALDDDEMVSVSAAAARPICHGPIVVVFSCSPFKYACHDHYYSFRGWRQIKWYLSTGMSSKTVAMGDHQSIFLCCPPPLYKLGVHVWFFRFLFLLTLFLMSSSTGIAALLCVGNTFLFLSLPLICAKPSDLLLPPTSGLQLSTDFSPNDSWLNRQSDWWNGFDGRSKEWRQRLKSVKNVILYFSA